MPVDDALISSLRAQIGVTDQETLGLLDENLIRRFARSIDEDNPLYFDRSFAQANGYPDIIAPPNLIVSIVTWDQGSPAGRLRRDGTEPTGHVKGLPDQGVRVMGGGEELTFHRPIVANSTVTMEGELTDVEEKVTKSGSIVILSYQNRYLDEERNLLLAAQRTVLLR